MPGQFVYDAGDLLHTEITANCSFGDMLENIEEYQLCNSFAVPVVTARLNHYWNMGIRSHKAVLEYLSQDSAAAQAPAVISENRSRLLTGEIPHVCIAGSEILTPEFYESLLNYMARSQDCATAGLTDCREIRDVRVFQWSDLHASVRDSLTFMERHSNIDLILSYWTNRRFQNLKADLQADICISTRNHQIEVLTDEGQLRCYPNQTTAELVGSTVYDLLRKT